MRDTLVKVAALYEAAASVHREGRLRDAEAGYRRVLALDPANADALNMLGLVAHAHGDGETAVRLMRASIGLRATAPYFYNLALVLEALGDVPAAIAAYRQAAMLDPKDVTNWSSAIFAGDLHPYSTPAVRLADRRTFNDLHCAALTRDAAPHTNDRDPDRRLRIGYLSADFVDHSAGLVFEPVLAGRDREAVEITLYWQRRQKADKDTERFKGYADHWRVVDQMTDEQLAQQIREDGIDILVDLAGYSNGQRLLALARKPAPIVMTAWGHVTGLGLDASDYILADPICVPPEHAGNHRERVLHMPCALAFDPRPPYPDVADPPAAKNGYVTFGYLGRASKTSDMVWATWAAILGRVPGSKLILKGREYGDATYRRRIVELFASLRVSSSRLEFRGASDRAHHLATYADVDVALDAFPHCGGVTTLEACLMGVPTVTLMGDHLNGRIGASILDTIGYWHLTAATREEYVDRAVWAAGAPQSRQDRLVLRAALLSSIICNPVAYARSVEALYRRVWREWVAPQPALASEPARELVAV